jgi:hypothetical protein
MSSQRCCRWATFIEPIQVARSNVSESVLCYISPERPVMERRTARAGLGVKW